MDLPLSSFGPVRAEVLICGCMRMVSIYITEIVRNFRTALQHSNFVDSLLDYLFYITMINRKNMVVIEAKQQCNLSVIKSGCMS